MHLGAPPAFLAAAGWRLLAAAADGALWVWDLQAPAVQLRASAAPLLALAPACGAPLEPPTARAAGALAVCVHTAACIMRTPLHDPHMSRPVSRGFN